MLILSLYYVSPVSDVDGDIYCSVYVDGLSQLKGNVVVSARCFQLHLTRLAMTVHSDKSNAVFHECPNSISANYNVII